MVKRILEYGHTFKNSFRTLEYFCKAHLQTDELYLEYPLLKERMQYASDQIEYSVRAALRDLSEEGVSRSNYRILLYVEDTKILNEKFARLIFQELAISISGISKLLFMMKEDLYYQVQMVSVEYRGLLLEIEDGKLILKTSKAI